MLDEKPRRLIGLALLAFLAGMTIHAYLPLRAAALFGSPDHAADNVVWGDARSWRGLWWVVSAHTFAIKQAVVQGQSTPGDLPFLPMEELGEVFALLAPAGIYFFLRRRGPRVAGLALLVAAAGSPALGAAAESLATRDESQQKASSLAVQPQQRHYVVSLVP